MKPSARYPRKTWLFRPRAGDGLAGCLGMPAAPFGCVAWLSHSGRVGLTPPRKMLLGVGCQVVAAFDGVG